MHLLCRADSRRIPLADESVHCVVTSPPYFGLRNYQIKGQLGLEATPAAYLAAMVAVFREVRRVLRDDGTCWLNIGDAYAHVSSGRGGAVDVRTDGRKTTPGQRVRGRMSRANTLSPGLKPKDLLGIPWRLALALQADGWYLRSEIIWAKLNPMPESVVDRPTKSHEQVFLLSKGGRYFYDAEAVKEPDRGMDHARRILAGQPALEPSNGIHPAHRGLRTPEGRDGSGRNMRSVLWLATEAYPGAHFATFPRKLVEPCIKAGTSERGVCPECGAPWVRVLDRFRTLDGMRRDDLPRMRSPDGTNGAQGFGHWRTASVSNCLGWRPSCCHQHEPIPATVFDPFAGSGTTLVVAEALGRRGIGLDLSPAYLKLASRRIERPHARIPRPGRADDLPLFAGLDGDGPGTAPASPGT